MLLQHPIVLWLLVPVALLVLIAAMRGRRVALPAAFVRIAAAAAILTAIAGPVGAYNISGNTVMFVVDRSGSVPDAAVPAEAKLVTDTLDHLAPNTRAGIVAFGGRAAVVFAPGDAPRDTARITTSLREADVDRTHTNIAGGLRLARAILTRGGGGQVFLLSDGQENTGDARTEANTAATEGIRITSLTSDALRFPDDVRVAAVDTPAAVWGGDALPVRATLTGTAAWKGIAHLSLDGVPAADTPIDATDGNGSLTTVLPALLPGTHVITARVEVTEGANRVPENDTLSVVTVVRGAPQALMIEGKPGEGKAVADALTARGVQVTAKTPRDIPPRLSSLSDTDAIIMVNVSAKDLSLDQMTTIQQSVRAGGKGLLVIGGDSAYGSGNYQTTPLEQVLPVRVDAAPAPQMQQQAILVIIDHSGSMDEQLGGGGINKIAAARVAATQLVANLPPNTIFGLEVFDDGADNIVPLAALPDNRDGIKDVISRVRAQGGTDIRGAMVAGINQMRGVVATEKHIVLMTDGQDNQYTHLADYQSLLDQMNADDVTFSTVGIGGDADQKLLSAMANGGHGTYYYVDTAADLPQITLRAVNEAGKQTTRIGNFHPSTVAPSPIIGEIPAAELPNLDGYAVTKAKPQADVILASGQKDPVLAQWQYGLGRVVAWTPDAGLTFAKKWPTWNRYNQFWQQALLWALPDPNIAALTVDTRAEGEEVVIGADATDADGRYVNSAPITGTLVTPEGHSFAVRLPQVGPGRYEVRVTAAAPGAYRLALSQPRAGGVNATRDGGFAVPYSAEYIPASGGAALLSDVASLTGGTTLASGATGAAIGNATAGAVPGAAGTITRYREYWPWFALAGLVLFLLDLGLRLSLGAGDRTIGGRVRGITNGLRIRRKRGARPITPRQPPPSMR